MDGACGAVEAPGACDLGVYQHLKSSSKILNIFLQISA